jgi:hypothetical protein
MTRLSLRLARPNVLASAALFAAVALYAVLTRRAMNGYLHDSGLSACLTSGADCQALARSFTDKFSVVMTSYRLITFIPLLIGMFWGGPLIARELEQGAAAGAIFKRTVPAMVITLVAYLPIKLGVQALRGHFLAPLQVTYAFGTTSPRGNSGDWILSSEVINRSGQIMGSPGVSSPCDALASRAQSEACAIEQGYRFLDTYQPLSRFWPLQLIESGIFLGLSVAVLGLAVWWILRRTA